MWKHNSIKTAEKIESLAFEKMNTSEAITVKEKPSASDKTLDKEKLYKYNNKYYYFNDILQDWLEYDEKTALILHSLKYQADLY